MLQGVQLTAGGETLFFSYQLFSEAFVCALINY